MTDPGASWSESESEVYRGLSRYAVPEWERQIGIITDLVQASEADGPILDLCCGEGLLTEALLRAVPDIPVHACDGSESMLLEVRRRTGPPARLVTRRIDLGASDWRPAPETVRAVVSSLAVHHLDDTGKQTLFADLHAALASGGVFVLADIVRPATPVGSRVAASMWDEEVRRRARDLDGSLAGYEKFRRADWNHFRHAAPDPIDKPSLLVEQIDWLRAAGFADVDLHWMIAGQTIISAWKR